MTIRLDGSISSTRSCARTIFSLANAGSLADAGMSCTTTSHGNSCAGLAAVVTTGAFAGAHRVQIVRFCASLRPAASP